MAGSVPWNGIVLEVLSKENYENWSALVRNHLKGRDLWDVVASNPCERGRIWEKKNAQALHAIQLSCGSNNLTYIRDIERAKDAWNQLQALFCSSSRGQPDIEQGVGDIPLLRHVERGDWSAASECIRDDPGVVLSSITPSGGTALHIAVIAGHEAIVENLVNLPEERLLEKQDIKGYTAVALVAASTGNIKMARCMIERSRTLMANMNAGQIPLLLIATDDDKIPLLLAATKGHKKLTRYLYEQTPLDELCRRDGSYGALLLSRCIANEIFDVALSLLHRFREVTLSHEFDNLMPLNTLTGKPSAFRSGSRFGPLQKLIYKSLGIAMEIIPNIDRNERLQPVNTGGALKRAPPGFKEVYTKKLTHLQVREILKCLRTKVSESNTEALEKAAAYDAMLEAAKYGIIEFIEAMWEANPNLLWACDRNNRGVFSYAILNRRRKVLLLLQKLDGRKEIITTRSDAFGNNLLHQAGLLGPSSDLNSVSSAALQMQREIQWFKGVKRIAHPRCMEMLNSEGKRPHEIFTQSHEELAKAADKWANDMATSFTIVGTLIITIMFAAAFTVPGGLNQETGIPIFLHSNKAEVKQDALFKLFIISDAASLFTSSTAVLIFIGILTSRYGERDFLRALPMKMLFGLFFLFVSVASMITAFCGALVMMLKGHTHVFIIALSLACIPILGFLVSQLPVFCQILKSTIRSNVFRLRKET